MLRIIQCLIIWHVCRKKLHVILACDEHHKKVFPGAPIIGSNNNNKNLKIYLVRDAFSDINEVGRCEPCDGKRVK